MKLSLTTTHWLLMNSWVVVAVPVPFRPKKLLRPETMRPLSDSSDHWAATSSGNLAPAMRAALVMPFQSLVISRILPLWLQVLNQA